MCDACRKALATMDTDEKLVHLHHTMRDLMNRQEQSIPTYLQNAKLYISNATSLQFNYHMQSQVLIRVTRIITLAQSPATLVIGERSWPVNGFSILDLGDDGMLITPETLITLTQATAGNLGLEFLGQEMADRGRRW